MNKKLKNYRKLVYNLRFGIEIETEFPEKVDISSLKDRYKKLLKSWDVVSDNSMNNGIEFRPADKNKIYFNKESFQEISEILHIIRKHKGDPSGVKCGLHLHLDAKKLTEAEIIKIVKEMVARQDFIIRDFKVRKDRLGRYCRRITKTDIRGLTEEKLMMFRNGQRIDDVKILNDKYYLLNLLSLTTHKSLEFRMFNGVRYVREIKRIVKFLFEFLITALERN